MDEVQAQLDNAVSRIEAAIDKGLGIPLTVQLRGALEYGIATGDMPAGARLPSVRAFAQRLRLSPVTVSNVYAALRRAGLIEARVGSGSYVAHAAELSGDMQDGQRALQAQIDGLVAAAAELGIGPSELALRVASAGSARIRPLKVLMLGIFQEATDYYAGVLRKHLPSQDVIVATIFENLRQEPVPGVDVVVTPRNMRPKALELFPDIPVVGMTFIPTEQTRIDLARISPDARVAIISYFPDFLTLMKAGIMRFAPHVTDAEAGIWNDPDIEKLIGRSDVMIYATGAGALRKKLTSRQTAIEYRHTPDPHAIRTELLPVLDAQRKQHKDKDWPREGSRLQLVRD